MLASVFTDNDAGRLFDFRNRAWNHESPDEADNRYLQRVRAWAAHADTRQRVHDMLFPVSTAASELLAGLCSHTDAAAVLRRWSR